MKKILTSIGCVISIAGAMGAAYLIAYLLSVERVITTSNGPWRDGHMEGTRFVTGYPRYQCLPADWFSALHQFDRDRVRPRWWRQQWPPEETRRHP